MLKMTTVDLELISDINMYLFVNICLLKKAREKVFLALLKDTAKPIINTWNRMMIVSQVNILHIWTQITCMVGQ